MNIIKIIEDNKTYYINFDNIYMIETDTSNNKVIIHLNNKKEIILNPSTKQIFKELSEKIIKKFNNDVDISVIKEIEVM